MKPPDSRQTDEVKAKAEAGAGVGAVAVAVAVVKAAAAVGAAVERRMATAIAGAFGAFLMRLKLPVSRAVRQWPTAANLAIWSFIYG